MTIDRSQLESRLAQAVLGLSVIVMFGWIFHSQMIVQVLPQSAPMQFNTALCFALTASALLAFSRTSRKLPAALLSSTALIISVIALIEYLTGSDSGLDRFFIEPFTVTHTSHAGRMAPNTALAFLLANCAVLLRVATSGRTVLTRMVIHYLAGLVIFIAMAGILSYTIQPLILGGAHITRMAIHTATGFVLIGTALALAIPIDKELRPVRANLAGFLTAMVTLGIWMQIESSEDQRVLRALEREAEGLKSHVLTDYQQQTERLTTAAQYLEGMDSDDSEENILDVLNALPIDARHAAVYRFVNGYATHLWGNLPTDAVKSAIGDSSAPSYAMMQSQPRITLWHPVISRRVPQRWLAVTEYDLRPSLQKVSAIANAELRIEITYDDGVELLADTQKDSGSLTQWVDHSIALPDGPRLLVRLGTTATFAAEHSSVIGPLFLVAALLFAAALSFALMLLQLAQSRLIEIEDKSRSLAEEVSERSRAQAELERQSKELLQSNRSLDEFAYVASHDLREPLRGIDASIRFLIEDHEDSLPEDARRRLDKVTELVEGMTHIINDLLRYSRLTRQGEAMKPASVEIIIDKALERLEFLLTERSIRVSREGPPFPEFVCNAIALGEAFANIIANAARYSSGDEAKLIIENCSNADEFRITFDDNGIGIPANKRDKVFKMFTRLHHRDEKGGGTGAGLAIVKRIVEMHHGTVSISDSQNFASGTRFTIRLPMNAEP